MAAVVHTAEKALPLTILLHFAHHGAPEETSTIGTPQLYI